MAKLDNCESCGIVIGEVEERYIEEYREHQVCSWCQTQWRHREERVGRTISWKEFTKGKLKRRYGKNR